MFLLICLLRLSLITASCLSWCQVHPRRSLRIEAYRKSSSGDDSLHSEDINGNNFRILMVLYEGEFKDEEGLGLLHYAAKHSNDPDMISLIIDKCKRVDTNLDTLSGWTPLELCLNRMDSNVEKIAKILVLNGADVFTKNPEGKSPIETIIKGNFNCLFSFLLGICFQNDSHMIEFIDICVRHKSWTRLDEILIKRPDLIASLKIQNVSVYTFTVEDAPITFRFCLENKLILQDENEFINWLVLKNSNELVKIALCYISYDVFRTKVLEFCKMEAVSEEFIDNMDKYLSDSK